MLLLSHRDHRSDQIRHLFQRIMRQMGIARRCLHALVSEQAADDWQRQASTDSKACEAVTKIVNANVIEAGERSDASPWLLQVDQMLARHFADNDIGIAFLAQQVGQKLLGWRVEGDDLGAVLVGLVLLEDEPSLRQIDARPLQRQDLAKPAAGKNQKPDRGGDIGIDRAVGLTIYQDSRQAFQFVLG